MAISALEFKQWRLNNGYSYNDVSNMLGHAASELLAFETGAAVDPGLATALTQKIARMGGR